ncbi:MAG: metallophosphoesterase [Nanoarchaeota archaeon]
MRFIYFQDFHIKSSNPINRIGDFQNDLLDKFKEILEMSKTYGCDFILSGGDFFDIPNVGNILCDKILDLIEETGIPIYGIFGNHDQTCHSTELSEASTLYHCFKRSELFSHLKK